MIMKKTLYIFLTILALSRLVDKTIVMPLAHAENETAEYRDYVLFPYDYDGYRVFLQGSGYGIISDSGKVVAPPEYEIITEYDHGIFVARKSNKEGYLRIDGEFFTDNSWTQVNPFYEGYAIAETQEGFLVFDDGFHAVLTVKRYEPCQGIVDHGFIEVKNAAGFVGVMDLHGSLTIDCMWDENDFRFGEGCIAFWEDGAWGLMNPYGDVLLTPQFSGAEYPSCNRISFLTKSETWIVYSAKGDLIYETPKHCSYVHYSDNHAVVLQNDENNDWLFEYIYDAQGNYVISNPEYSIVSDFYCGRALVKFTAGDVGYIDTVGNIVCRGFKDATDFYRNVAVIITPSNEKRYIDIEGIEINVGGTLETEACIAADKLK